MPDSSLTLELFSWYPIEKYGRVTRREDQINPFHPFCREAHMTHYLNYGIVLDSVKSFGKVKLENYDKSFTLLALVNIFKALGNAILDGSGFDVDLHAKVAR